MLKQTPLPAPKMNYALPVGKPHAGTERAYDLTIKYTEGDIYDPTTDTYQKVRLRSYTGDTDGKTPFVGPLIEAAPGDTVRVSLDNQLPDDPSCLNASGTPDSPHCFNGTNLHSHGLWVSPTGNSDNVLLSLNPGVKFQYEYNIPADHPAGTFWYHPHRHGSTALQVSSGMAGALILKGDRKPQGKAGAVGATNGDLDTLLVSAGADAKPFPDRTLVFQQIQYACTGTNGKLKYNSDGTIDWSCKPGETGVIESYNQFGPGTWQDSDRWTSINGTVLPTFEGIEAGQVERWRTIHAGVRDTINLQIVRANFNAANGAPTQPTKANLPNFLKQICSGYDVPYQVAAADGLTMGDTFTSTKVTLQPGYRFDLLTVFPESGVYCLMEPATPKAGSVSNQNEPVNFLGFISVGGSKKIAPADITKTLVDALTASAKAHMPADVVDEVVADLNKTENGKPTPKLTRFVPHPTVTEEEVKASGQKLEELVFFIGTGDANVTQFAVGNSFDVIPYADYLVPKGAAPYDPNRSDRNLVLGTTQQWELRSYSVSHPFHIHVNPFQIVGIYDPSGKDVSLPGVAEADGDNQFAGLSGVWKDTIFVKTNLNPGQLTNPPKDYYRIVVRTRYQRYIGEFVLHCHILDHEDQGMMQNVTIGIPDGKG
ncbi:L-ascorbate oxidase, partial [Elstera litoralis]